MSKNKNQGTRWESAVVKAAREFGLKAERIAEGGSKDYGDVLVKSLYPEEPPITALAWKRLTLSDGGARRSPDGEPEVAVLTMDDFFLLLSRGYSNAIIECKATERLNVTRALHKARQKAKQYDGS